MAQEIPSRRVYSRSEARKLFKDFADIELRTYFLNKRWLPLFGSSCPGRLNRGLPPAGAGICGFMRRSNQLSVADQLLVIHALNESTRNSKPNHPLTTDNGPQTNTMKNILITGGAGFIGSHLVDHLLEKAIGLSR